MRKELPIGIEDYDKSQNYYYVDKTLIIDEIIRSMIGKSILVTRPRRFGKTLTVSMLDYFFSNQLDSDSLFSNKKIASTASYAYLNKYPVIHINMRTVNGSNEEEIIYKAINNLSSLYEKHQYLLNSGKLSDIDKDYYRSIIAKTFSHNYLYQDSLFKLSSFLFKHFNQKVIILIDEYDTPCESSYENKIYEKTIGFFEELYSSALKGNDNVLFSFVTGVLEISKESLFSGLNNMSVHSVIDNKLNIYFGFTKEETLELLKDYDLLDKYDELEKWYGGYEFGNTTLFNPWSIINYVEKQQNRPHWVNTAQTNIIRELLVGHVKEEFLSLVNNQYQAIMFNNAINYLDFTHDKNAIYSYLTQAGYIIAKYKEAPNLYSVRIPNREIYEVFKNDIIAKEFNISLLQIASRLKVAFENNKIDDISIILDDYIVSSLSYYDVKNEKTYQALLTGILAVLFDTHIVNNEVNTLKGRCDIMVSPKQDNDIGLIVEVKYRQNVKSVLSSNKLKDSAKSAINQIESHKYYQELLRRKCSKILLYGITFDINGDHALESKELNNN